MSRIYKTEKSDLLNSKLVGNRDLAYSTGLGKMFIGEAKKLLTSSMMEDYKGKIQLIFTSPPFPLTKQKKYGNHKGQEYVDWLSSFAVIFRDLLKPDGSIVIELGNSWEPKKPIMSTLNLQALLAFLNEGDFNLCQQFVHYNPARLPSPVQWVNVERIRVKDAFTYIWWMSPNERPMSNNRNVLTPYSESMKKLLSSQKYNSGKRPSEHSIGTTSFLKNNKGSIPSNVLTLANTKSFDTYQSFCRSHDLPIHPCRMHPEIPEFFIRFLTQPSDIVLDPFAVSNTTGAIAERLGRRWLTFEINEYYVRGSRAWFISK
jgi:site-specific DNA-methyltransferase (cytosine-N4-specific)